MSQCIAWFIICLAGEILFLFCVNVNCSANSDNGWLRNERSAPILIASIEYSLGLVRYRHQGQTTNRVHWKNLPGVRCAVPLLAKRLEWIESNHLKSLALRNNVFSSRLLERIEAKK